MATIIPELRFCVNRTNQTIQTFTHFGGTSTGDIRPGEFFRWEMRESAPGGFGTQTLTEVYTFRPGGGQRRGVFGLESVQDQPLFFRPVTFQALGILTWMGRNFNLFSIQNREARLIDRFGVDITNIPIGRQIAVERTIPDSVMGVTHKSFWRIAGVQQADGRFEWADRTRQEHAFVDTGLWVGDAAATVSIRTNLV